MGCPVSSVTVAVAPSGESSAARLTFEVSTSAASSSRGSRRHRRCRGPRHRRRWQPGRGTAAWRAVLALRRSVSPVQRVESSGSWLRSTDCQLPLPCALGPPVQVTHTCWTPADGSPVARTRKRSLPSVPSVPWTSVMAGARGEGRSVGTEGLGLISGVEEPQAEPAVGALGVGRQKSGRCPRRCGTARATGSGRCGHSRRGRRSSWPWPASAGRTSLRMNVVLEVAPSIAGAPVSGSNPWCPCRTPPRKPTPRSTRSGYWSPSTVTLTTCLGSAGKPGSTVTPSRPSRQVSCPGRPRRAASGDGLLWRTPVGRSSGVATSRSSVHRPRV